MGMVRWYFFYKSKTLRPKSYFRGGVGREVANAEDFAGVGIEPLRGSRHWVVVIGQQVLS